MLIPLNPPGHALHPELDTAGQRPARNFCIPVELGSTCTREQLGESILWFLQHSEEELRWNQKPGLPETLCLGSYPDKQRTACWFYQLVRSAWLLLLQSCLWHLLFQPCRRSCKFQLSKGKKSLMAEVTFGVHQGSSDTFVSSQPTVPPSPRAQRGLRPACGRGEILQAHPRQCPLTARTWNAAALPCILMGTGFSSSAWKRAGMQPLNTAALSRWRRRDFLQRLWHILEHLSCSQQLKHLDHFVIGSKRVPVQISFSQVCEWLNHSSCHSPWCRI